MITKIGSGIPISQRSSKEILPDTDFSCSGVLINID